MTTHGTKAQVAPVRPELTATLMAETGIDEGVLRWLVHGFYARVRADGVRGQVFVSRLSNWDAHLGRMVAFWSSMGLMSGQYRGHPVADRAERIARSLLTMAEEAQAASATASPPH